MRRCRSRARQSGPRANYGQHNVCSVRDGALDFRQDRIMTVHGSVPAHQDRLGSIKGRHFIGMPGVEFLHPGVTQLLNLGGKIVALVAVRRPLLCRCCSSQKDNEED